MKIAITGGTGFVGSHLVRHLLEKSVSLTVLARGYAPDSFAGNPKVNYVRVQYEDQALLESSFSGCDAVAHLAGINKEIEADDFQKVHVKATESVLEAAGNAGVKKIVFVSFLRARENINSKYHRSKWQAEELIRNSGLDYTILKPGMIYGRGDHMLSHITTALKISPFFAPVGLFNKPVSPISIDDVINIMSAALLDNRLSRKTHPVIGPEALPLQEVVRRTAKAQNKLSISIPLPIAFHMALATVCEAISKNPLVTVAQIKMLAEGMDKPLENEEQLPDDLQPKVYLTEKIIRQFLGSDSLG